MTLNEWCSNNKDIGTNIKAEWTGQTEQGDTLSLDGVYHQSNKRVLWRCVNDKSHLWYTTIQKRTLINSGCPFCKNQKFNDKSENNLKNWCLLNNKNWIIAQFVGKDENGRTVDIAQVGRASHKRVMWRHITDDGSTHTWIARISDRTYKNSGCPICNGRNNLKQGINDLRTWCNNNADVGKQLKEAWTGLDKNMNKIDMSTISYGSKKEVLMKCACGKLFNRSILALTSNKTSIIQCTKCSKQNVAKIRVNKTLEDKSLLNWCINNKTFGETIINEYTGIDYKGNKVKIDEITYGSNTKMLWKHTKNKEEHEWYATVHNRVSHKTLCPICSNKGTSLPEQIIYRCIKQVYTNTINRGKLQEYEIDIAIPELRTCIEYGSTYYHDGREQRDKEKKELCKLLNIRLIQIIEDSEQVLNEIWQPDLIVTQVKYDKLSSIENIVKYLCNILDIKYNNIDFNLAVNEAIDFMNN